MVHSSKLAKYLEKSPVFIHQNCPCLPVFKTADIYCNRTEKGMTDSDKTQDFPFVILVLEASYASQILSYFITQ